MAWPQWQSEIVVLQQPFLVIGGGFLDPPAAGLGAPSMSWWQEMGTGTCIRVGGHASRAEWRVSLFIASEPISANLLPDRPSISGTNTLDLTRTGGVFRISGCDQDLGTPILLKFRERNVTFDWEGRSRNGEIDVITVILRKAHGDRQPSGRAFL